MAEVINIASRLAKKYDTWADIVNGFEDVVIVGRNADGSVETMHAFDDDLSALGLLVMGWAVIMDPDE